MDGAVFGSYSLTEFVDLYFLNRRNNHHYAVFFEVDSHGIVKIKNDKIDNFKKSKQGNYLIGILMSSLDDLTIETTGISYFDSPHELDLDYLCKTKKEFFYFMYEESKIRVTTAKHEIFMSGNGSLSTIEVHGYSAIKPNPTYNIEIFRDNQFITQERNIEDGYENQELYKE